MNVFLPVALVLTLAALWVVGLIVVARLDTREEYQVFERATCAALFAIAFPIGLLVALGAVDCITRNWFLATLVTGLGVLALAGGTDARRRALDDSQCLADCLLLGLRDRGTRVVWIVIAAALFLATTAAYVAPPFAWDALGYHLPIVHDAIQSHTLRHIPTHTVYINAYPRAVEVYFIFWQLVLRDDTWIELAQVPFAYAGTLGAASIATRAGVRDYRALAICALFVAIPIVVLQLASNYIDVAYACLFVCSVALVTGTLDATRIFWSGLACALLLASKPTAPVLLAIALLGVLLVSRTKKRLFAVVRIGALAMVLGGWKYITNWSEYRNPVWPVRVTIGPWSLPGRGTVEDLLASQVPENYSEKAWLARLLSSWFTQPVAYNFDMRIGGFWPVFPYVLLPVAIVAWFSPGVRKIAVPIALILFGALAMLGAFLPRFTMAVPLASLIVFAAATDSLSARRRSLTDATLGIAAGIGLFLAYPGFLRVHAKVSDVLKLHEVARLSEEERLTAIVLDKREAEWESARNNVGPGQSFGYDASFGLPGQLWRHDGSGRISYIESAATLDELQSWIARERIAVAALDNEKAGKIAKAHPGQFSALFECPFDACTVFKVSEHASLGGAAPAQ